MRPIYIENKSDFERAVLPGEKGIPGVEGLHLDFKRDHAPGKARDLAIDIAAFANSAGGCLVIGVAEDPNNEGTADSLHPIRVDKTMGAIKDALTRWTYGFDELPQPFRLAVDSAAGSSAEVVVVNVYPSARLIAMRPANGGNEISYPFRHSHGNAWLKPEEVEHRLDTRRGFACRNQLATWLREADGRGVSITLYYLQPSSTDHSRPIRNVSWESRVTLVHLTPDGAALQFVLRKGERREFAVPYEWIVSVWRIGGASSIQLAAFVWEGESGLGAKPLPWSRAGM